MLSMSDHLAMFRDKSGKLSIGDIIDDKGDPFPFKNVEGDPSAGYTSDAIWIRLTVERDGSWPEGVSIMLHPPFLQNLDIYVPRTARPATAADFKVFHRGTHHFTDQPGQWHLFYTLPLSLPDADQVTLYFRIKTESSATLTGSFATTTGILDYAVNWTCFAAGLITLSVIGLIISLFLWAQSRRRFFLSFSFLMFCNAFLVACHIGFLRPVDGAMSDNLFTAASLLTTLGNLVFVYDQIFPRHELPWIKSAFRAIILYNIIGFSDLIFTSLPYDLIIKPLLLSSMAAVYIFFWISFFTHVRSPRPGGLTTLLAAFVQAVFASSNVISLLGGPALLPLEERGYWITMGPFTLLMMLSIIIRGNHVQYLRQLRASQGLARQAEKRAHVLAEQRTKALQEAKEAAESSLIKEKNLHGEQTRFVDIIRHQYQTPIAVIRSSTATLLETIPPDETANRNRLQRIQAATVDLNEILQVSLKRSRMEKPPEKGNFEPVSFDEFVTATIERCRKLYAKHSIDLRLEPSNKGTSVKLDKRLVAVALDNLIGNSAKFSPNGSQIRITAGINTGDAIISVSDEGIGIPKAEQANLTQKYFRGSNTGNVNGTGLGLHIVSEVARLHGGSFEIINNSSTRGTTAVLTLKIEHLPSTN